jgi:hypothetical protein
MTTDPITTRTAKIWLRADGLIQVVPLPNIKSGLADAKENVAAITRFASAKKRPVLIDIRASQGIDRETRAYYSSAEGVKSDTALALLVESPVTQVMANFFIGFNQPPVPTRLFTSEAEAVAWLKGFRE